MKYLKKFEIKSGKIAVPLLILATKRGSNAKVKELIKSGEDINITDDSGYTPLMNAVNENYLIVVKTLIDAGADVNIKNHFKKTALFYAATPKIIDLLLDADADVNVQDKNGYTSVMSNYKPPYLNYLYLNLETLKKFIEHGLNLDIKNYTENKNIYEMIKDKTESQNNIKFMNHQYWEVIEYLDKNYPQYKKEWDFNKSITNYNL